MTGYRGPRSNWGVDEEKLKKLWPSSLTDRELGERFGCTKDTIRAHGFRLGLPTRPIARAQAQEQAMKRTATGR